MTSDDSIPLYLVDAFAHAPFTGNPAAVCLLNHWPADAWLQSVAAELKHSETAFIRPRGGDFELRWFTPAVEVDLCGHATLAGAFVLWHAGIVTANEPIRFATRSGVLIAQGSTDGIELDFPLDPVAPCAVPADLLESLGTTATFVGRGRFDLLVEVDSERELRRLAPDYRRLASVDCRGVIVTAPASGPANDFVSRFFAPASGIDEDPVTGSAHCALADYWRRRLGKSDFCAHQASPRGGTLRVAVAGDRVRLRGRAVLVFAGRLRVSP